MRKVTFLGACLLMACGGAAETTEEAQVADTSGSEAPQIAWADMSPEQRGEYMTNVVVPHMRPIFQAYDAEEFADFGCPTCHGANAQEVGFRMPNGLHPLNPMQIPSMFESEDPEVQRLAQFMGGQVMPAMIELLGAQPYSPETQEGFGCLNCHATAE